MSDAAPDVALNYRSIKTRIADAASAAGRDPNAITLIAVAKRQPADRIVRLLELGHRVFGENRVEEAAARWPGLRRSYSGIQLHMVGALQSKKCADAVALFDAIHSLDRTKLASKLAEQTDERDRSPELFVQVNTGDEPQKSGVSPRDLGAFLDQCRDEAALSISGLMCLPPIDEEPALHFALLAKLAEQHGLEKLSMGMSEDFETAIAFGATHVRIGTALFGSRIT